MSSTSPHSNDREPLNQDAKGFIETEKYKWETISVGKVPPVPPIPDDVLETWRHRASRRASYTSLSIKGTTIVERPVWADSSRPISTASTLAGWAGGVRGPHSEDQRKLQAIWASDPGNPRNWSQVKKVYTASVSIFASIVACAGTTTIMPAQTELGRIFGSSEAAVSLSVALYLIALACGPLFCAFSTRLAGRKTLTTASLFLLFAFLIGAAFVPTLAGLLVLRLLAGLSASIPAYLPSIVLQDLWTMKERSIPLTTYYGLSLFGPILGFVLGSPIVQVGQWRWSQFLLVILAGCSFALMLTTGESQRRAIFQRNQGVRQVTPSIQVGLDAFVTMVNSLATQPEILLTTLYTSVALGSTFSILQAFTVNFGKAFDVDIGKQGIVLLSMVVGLLLGVLCLFMVETFIYRPRTKLRFAQASTDAESTSTSHRVSRRISRAVSMPVLSSKNKSFPLSLKEANRGSRASIGTSLHRLASRTSLMDLNQPTPQDKEKNIHLSIACANYLNSISENEGRRIMPERILLVLNKSPAFGDLCNTIDGYHLRYDRVKLAKVLVDAVNRLPASPASDERPITPALVRSKSMHLEASLAALEDPMPSPPLQTHPTPAPGTETYPSNQRQKLPVPCEWRLWAALPATILAPVALFVLAWTASASQSLAAGVITLGLFAFSLPLIHVPMVQYLTDRYRSRTREAALGGMVMVQYIISFSFTLAANPMYSALGIGWATSVLAFLMLGFGLVPWLLYFCSSIFGR